MIKKTPKKPYCLRLPLTLIERCHRYSGAQRRSTNEFIILALEKATSGKLKDEFTPDESDNPVFIKDSDRT